MIYLPMKNNNSRINWHGMGLLYHSFLVDKTKYIRPFKKYNKVVLEYKEIVKKG